MMPRFHSCSIKLATKTLSIVLTLVFLSAAGSRSAYGKVLLENDSEGFEDRSRGGKIKRDVP